MVSAEDMIAKGKAKLEEHYRRFPPEKYLECGEKGGIDTAICLHENRKRIASAEAWIAKWETAMRKH